MAAAFSLFVPLLRLVVVIGFTDAIFALYILLLLLLLLLFVNWYKEDKVL